MGRNSMVSSKPVIRGRKHRFFASRGSLLSLLLFAFAFAHAERASAQVETFTFTGAPFLTSGCAANPVCTGGSLSATATAIPVGGGAWQVIEYSASGAGISLGISDVCAGSGSDSFGVDPYGQVNGWDFILSRPCSQANPWQTIDSLTVGDVAAETDSM